MKTETKEIIKIIKTLNFSGLILSRYSLIDRKIRYMLYAFFVFLNIVPLFLITYFAEDLSFLSTVTLLIVYPLGDFFRRKMESFYEKWDYKILKEYEKELSIKLEVERYTFKNLTRIKEVKLKRLLDEGEINKNQYNIIIQEISKENSEERYKMRMTSISLKLLLSFVGAWLGAITSGTVFKDEIFDLLLNLSYITFFLIILLPWIEYNLFKIHQDLQAKSNREFRLFLIDYGFKHYGN